MRNVQQQTSLPILDLCALQSYCFGIPDGGIPDEFLLLPVDTCTRATPGLIIFLNTTRNPAMYLAD
jgi:hypothetical protein